MAKNGIGFALSLVNKFASSDLVDKLKIRKPAEKIAYASTRAGFQIASSASQGLQQVRNYLTNPFQLQKPEKSDLFDLTLNDEQLLIRDSLRRFAIEKIRPEASVINDAPHLLSKVNSPLRTAFDELGIVEYAIPETFGGLAQVASPVSNVLIAEDLAYGDMGIALSLMSNFCAANIISRWGTPDQQANYLPALLGENPLRATLAVNEPAPLFNPMQMQTKAIPEDGGYRLIGKKSLVVQGMDAEIFIVAAALPDGQSKLFLLDASIDGLLRKPEPTMGIKAASTARLKLDNIFVPTHACIGNDTFNWRRCLDLGTVMWCGMAIGTAQAMLDYVIPYCNERKAFGEPISHRQSVAFMIADMATEVEAMRLLTYRAAARIEQGLDSARETYLAKLFCAEKSVRIATDGVQLLGGHGFTKEHPVERWYRDLIAITVQFNTLHA